MIIERIKTTLMYRSEVGERTFLSNHIVQDDSKGWLPLGSAGAGAEAAESDIATKIILNRRSRGHARRSARQICI
jgi:hypothetical protein